MTKFQGQSTYPGHLNRLTSCRLTCSSYKCRRLIWPVQVDSETFCFNAKKITIKREFYFSDNHWFRSPMNNRSAMNPISSDFSGVLRKNCKELNSLPPFDVSFLDKNTDWYLLAFLREQQRNGHTYETSFAALTSIVGTFADSSYYFNPFTNRIGHINQNHHLLGESGK